MVLEKIEYYSAAPRTPWVARKYLSSSAELFGLLILNLKCRVFELA